MLRSMRLEREGKDSEIYLCAHWKSFPPPGASAVLEGDTPAVVRSKGLITVAEMQRLQVWQQMCGLTTMHPDKCLKCPHLLQVFIKQNLAYIRGQSGRVTPLVEAAVLEAGAHYRENTVLGIRPAGTPGSGRYASWVYRRQEGEDATRKREGGE